MSAPAPASLASRLPSGAAYVVHGAIGRELRAQAQAILALALLFGVLDALLVFLPRFGLLGQSAASLDLFIMISLFASLICGVIAGAQEEEDATADFPRRLPVTRLRIFSEKLIGGGLAFALWVAVALLLIGLVTLAANGRFEVSGLHTEIKSRHLGIVTLLFSSGVLGGQIGRKAVVGALTAGVLMVPPLFLWGGPQHTFPQGIIWGFLTVSLIYLVVASAIFVRREGR